MSAAKPLTGTERLLNYRRQRGIPPSLGHLVLHRTSGLTPRQTRRYQKKLRSAMPWASRKDHQYTSEDF